MLGIGILGVMPRVFGGVATSVIRTGKIPIIANLLDTVEQIERSRVLRKMHLLHLLAFTAAARCRCTYHLRSLTLLEACSCSGQGVESNVLIASSTFPPCACKQLFAASSGKPMARSCSSADIMLISLPSHRIKCVPSVIIEQLVGRG